MDSAQEESLDLEHLPANIVGLGKAVLHAIDVAAREQGIERCGVVVQAVGRFVQDGGRAHLRKADDDKGGASTVFDGADLLLQSRDDTVRQRLIAPRGRAGLSESQCQRGFREQGLGARLVGADPKNLAHVAAQRTSGPVDVLPYLAHGLVG